MSQSCQTDICRTVRRFSRLLPHRSVISDKNSFFTSSKAWHGFDCFNRDATTFKITEKKRWKSKLKSHLPTDYWKFLVKLRQTWMAQVYLVDISDIAQAAQAEGLAPSAHINRKTTASTLLPLSRICQTATTNLTKRNCCAETMWLFLEQWVWDYFW